MTTGCGHTEAWHQMQRLGTVTHLSPPGDPIPYYRVHDETGETHHIRSDSLENRLASVSTGMRVRLTWVRTASGAWWAVTDATRKEGAP
jgi:hypothetical protein